MTDYRAVMNGKTAQPAAARDEIERQRDAVRRQRIAIDARPDRNPPDWVRAIFAGDEER